MCFSARSQSTASRDMSNAGESLAISHVFFEYISARSRIWLVGRSVSRADPDGRCLAGWSQLEANPGMWRSQTAWIGTSTLMADSRWRMSAGSDVTIAARLGAAVATTEASTTSEVSAAPQSRPAERASGSSIARTLHPRSICDSRACGPPRQACARTVAGTVGAMPRRNAASWSAHTWRSERSPATSAPVS